MKVINPINISSSIQQPDDIFKIQQYLRSLLISDVLFTNSTILVVITKDKKELVIKDRRPFNFDTNEEYVNSFKDIEFVDILDSGVLYPINSISSLDLNCYHFVDSNKYIIFDIKVLTYDEIIEKVRAIDI